MLNIGLTFLFVNALIYGLKVQPSEQIQAESSTEPLRSDTRPGRPPNCLSEKMKIKKTRLYSTEETRMWGFISWREQRFLAEGWAGYAAGVIPPCRMTYTALACGDDTIWNILITRRRNWYFYMMYWETKQHNRWRIFTGKIEYYIKQKERSNFGPATGPCDLYVWFDYVIQHAVYVLRCVLCVCRWCTRFPSCRVRPVDKG